MFLLFFYFELFCAHANYPLHYKISMPFPITKQTIEHIAELARIELTPREEEKLLADLRKILGYFEDLTTLDTSGVKAMSGGTALTNVFREDEERENTSQGAGKESFPEKEGGFLKIPPVFE